MDKDFITIIIGSIITMITVMLFGVTLYSKAVQQENYETCLLYEQPECEKILQ